MRFVIKNVQLSSINSYISNSRKVGDQVKIAVKSSSEFQLTTIFYIVMHGSKIFQVSTEHAYYSTETEISFTITDEMKAFVDVIVYYLHESGETIYDEIRVELPVEAESYVSGKLCGCC